MNARGTGEKAYYIHVCTPRITTLLGNMNYIIRVAHSQAIGQPGLAQLSQTWFSYSYGCDKMSTSMNLKSEYILHCMSCICEYSTSLNFAITSSPVLYTERNRGFRIAIAHTKPLFRETHSDKELHTFIHTR